MCRRYSTLQGPNLGRSRRPDCAMQPVRTVPFFNLYDDIQITQLGTQSPIAQSRCLGRAVRRVSERAPGHEHGHPDLVTCEGATLEDFRGGGFLPSHNI